jgi:uncharacterized protein
MPSVPERAISIDCRGDELLAIVHTPVEPAGEVAALIVVGGPQYRVGSHRMFVDLARSLARSGVPTVRFDCRGMGDSDGTFTSFEDLADDIRAAVDATEKAIGARRVVLVGLCDGASASIMYCASDARIAGMVLMNPWVRSSVGEAKARIDHYYGNHLREGDFWRRLITGKVNIARALKGLLSNIGLAKQSRAEAGTHYIAQMLRALTAFQERVLIILSRDDLTAQEFMGLVGDSPEWKRAVDRANVVSHVVEDSDHTFSGVRQIEEVATLVAEFFSSDSRGDVRA